MTFDPQRLLVFWLWRNVDRYQRLLKTCRSDHEREFIERQFGEEEDALLEIAKRTTFVDLDKTVWAEPLVPCRMSSEGARLSEEGDAETYESNGEGTVWT